jgi:hypothetical protein
MVRMASTLSTWYTPYTLALEVSTASSNSEIPATAALDCEQDNLRRRKKGDHSGKASQLTDDNTTIRKD